MDGGGADDLFDHFSLDADGDVLFSLDGPSSCIPKAAPKLTGKFQPKIKGKAPKSEPAPEVIAESGFSRQQQDGFEAKPPLLPVKKQDDDSRTLAAEFSGRDSAAEDDGLAVGTTIPMEVDDVQEEDVVVREFDVYLSPSPLEPDTQLFVVQYPLRPSWQSYDLDKLRDVRVKPKQTLVELDIATDYPDNYDSELEEYPLQSTRTFSSSRAPLVTSHCVGFLKRNQLHLNPVNAVAQLRPSIGSMKSSKEKRPVARSQGNNVLSNEENGNATLDPSSSKGNQIAATTGENQGEVEDWVSVEFHSSESNISKRYKEKMVAQDGSNISFSMRSCDYLTNFCPGISVGTRGPSKRLLFTLPLEDRLRHWFSQGPQVHLFSAVTHLAPKGTAKEDILALLPQFAVLVQGLWVSKSSLLFEGYEALARDYILLLFNKSIVIPKQKLEPVRQKLDAIKKDSFNQIMIPLARERIFKDWKFREATDTKFLKCYSDSDIVHDQQCFWSNLEQHIESDLHINVTNSAAIKRGHRVSTTNSMDRIGGKNSSEGSGSTIIPVQARDILPKAILKVFRINKVCGINTICQKLRDVVIDEAVLSKRNPIAAASWNFSPHSKELRDMITQVALEIHNVYVLKSIDAAIDPFRKVVIDLLRGSPSQEKLKKAQIYAAAQKVLGKDITNQEYIQVMNELCVFKGGGWVLKPGDGKPD